jgi:hypothetical protein
MTITPGGKTLDIDGNGVIDPMTDGLLALRYLFGFTGDVLVADAVAGNCTRCGASAIESHIVSILPLLDVDDNGLPVQALTDGLLVLRRMFGFSGDALISGAVAADCMRCDAGPIATYIDGL